MRIRAVGLVLGVLVLTGLILTPFVGWVAGAWLSVIGWGLVACLIETEGPYR